MAAGNLVVYAIGVTHLSQFVGINRALLLGVAPFVIGDLLKLFLGVRALKTSKVFS
jgi:biotin transport system substrate-specific component